MIKVAAFIDFIKNLSPALVRNIQLRSIMKKNELRKIFEKDLVRTHYKLPLMHTAVSYAWTVLGFYEDEFRRDSRLRDALDEVEAQEENWHQLLTTPAHKQSLAKVDQSVVFARRSGSKSAYRAAQAVYWVYYGNPGFSIRCSIEALCISDADFSVDTSPERKANARRKIWEQAWSDSYVQSLMEVKNYLLKQCAEQENAMSILLLDKLFKRIPARWHKRFPIYVSDATV
jgi:hypothetical protein